MERSHLNRKSFTGPYNPLHLQLDSEDNPLPGNKSFYAVDAISMRHGICYRDNDTPAGKHECDRTMLAELNALVPEGRREKVNRQQARSIIGLKHRMGLGIYWNNQLANEIHEPVRRRFDKRTVFAKQVDDIWAADLVEMSSYSRSIDVLCKYGWIVPLKIKTGRLHRRFGNCSSVVLLVVCGRIKALNSTTNR